MIRVSPLKLGCGCQPSSTRQPFLCSFMEPRPRNQLLFFGSRHRVTNGLVGYSHFLVLLCSYTMEYWDFKNNLIVQVRGKRAVRVIFDLECSLSQTYRSVVRNNNLLTFPPTYILQSVTLVEKNSHLFTASASSLYPLSLRNKQSPSHTTFLIRFSPKSVPFLRSSVYALPCLETGTF